jgi:hypothetical protein
MDGFSHEGYSEEIPPMESVPIQVRLQGVVGSLAPQQRLILSIFLFMDVCILSFAVLFLFNKIELPF